MKTLVINIPTQEFRVFNEKNQNWEIESFKELGLEENENFATQIQEIQERFNVEISEDLDLGFEFDVTVQLEMFGGLFEFELFGDTTQIKGVELFNPETNEVFIESENGHFIFIGNPQNWNIGDLELKEITVPSEVDGSDLKVMGYEYELEEGDIDVYDLLNYSNR